jgi:long-chain acyl-CoA synthetase
MSPGQTAPRGASKPHATDGIWYASYPRDVAHEIDRLRISSMSASSAFGIASPS